MPSPRPKTIVVMPAYNAARTLERTLADLPLSHVNELILVDDASQDETVALAEKIAKSYHLPFSVVRLPTNRGYGGNQKECYRAALARGADIVVMLHPDYQYDPRLVKHLVEFIREGYFDVMLGSRIRSREEALAGGMPAYKYLANRVLTLLENIASGRNLGEWHTGMRAYRRGVLEALPFNTFSDDFIFDQQVLFAIVEKGYSIGDIPVPVRYFAEASSINLKRSIIYGTRTLLEVARFLLRKYRQVLTYLVAGALAFGTNQAVYAALLYNTNLWYLWAGIISFLSGGVTGFLLQKYWVFGHKNRAAIGWQLPAYLALITVNLGLTALLLYGVVEWLALPKLLANMLATLVVALWSFVIYKRLIFVDRRAVLPADAP